MEGGNQEGTHTHLRVVQKRKHTTSFFLLLVFSFFGSASVKCLDSSALNARSGRRQERAGLGKEPPSLEDISFLAALLLFAITLLCQRNSKKENVNSVASLLADLTAKTTEKPSWDLDH